MRDIQPTLPQPTPNAVALWAKSVNREHLHTDGWIAINKRFHGMARAMRPFISKHFDEAEQEAAFDGMTLALLMMAHFDDVQKLSELLADVSGTASQPAALEALNPDKNTSS